MNDLINVRSQSIYHRIGIDSREGNHTVQFGIVWSQPSVTVNHQESFRSWLDVKLLGTTQKH